MRAGSLLMRVVALAPFSRSWQASSAWPALRARARVL